MERGNFFTSPIAEATAWVISNRHDRRWHDKAANENPLSYWQKLERALRLEFSRSGIDRAESC